MGITISADDPRSIRAVEIAAVAGQWLKVRAKDGRKAYGVPSQRKPGVYHLATCQWCSCWDFQRHQQPCKHILAVRLHVTLATAQRARTRRSGRAIAVAPSTAVE